MLYFFSLPTALRINGQTHVQVVREVVEGSRLALTGVYGKLSAATGVFTPAQRMFAFEESIKGHRLEDMRIQARDAGRPESLPDHSFRSADIITYLEEDVVVKQARIDARVAAAAEVERMLQEAARAERMAREEEQDPVV